MPEFRLPEYIDCATTKGAFYVRAPTETAHHPTLGAGINKKAVRKKKTAAEANKCSAISRVDTTISASLDL